MGPTWDLSAPDGTHVGPMNLAVREVPPISTMRGQPFLMTSITWNVKCLRKLDKVTPAKRIFNAQMSLPIGKMHSLQPWSTSSMTAQSHSTPWRHNRNTNNLDPSTREWGRNSFEIYGSAAVHNFIYSCTRAKPWMIDNVYVKGNQMKLFQ